MPDIKIETTTADGRECEYWIRNIEVFTFKEVVEEIRVITDDFEYSVVDVSNYPMDDPREYFGFYFENREHICLWKFYEVALAFDEITTNEEESALVCFLEDIADDVVPEPFDHKELLKNFREHYKGSFYDSEEFAKEYLTELYDLPDIVQFLINWKEAADHLSQDYEYIDGQDGMVHVFQR